MTPKEKAKYLFDMFYNISGNHPAAKKSCRICVDEMQKWIRTVSDRRYYVEDYNHWQEVKQEIEIL